MVLLIHAIMTPSRMIYSPQISEKHNTTIIKKI
jgi:hypothetical protein